MSDLGPQYAVYKCAALKEEFEAILERLHKLYRSYDDSPQMASRIRCLEEQLLSIQREALALR